MKRGLFVTRSEPFHNGHLSAVKEIDGAPDLDEIVIGIGSSQYSHTLDNPFTFEEREQMVRRTLENKVSKPFQIVGIPDIHDYPKWIPHVIESTPEFQVVYVGNTIVAELFTNEGYEVRSPPMIEGISATRIRELMTIDGNWQDYVPEQVRKFIEKINGAQRVKELARERGVKPIGLSKIVIVRSFSLYEYDLKYSDLSHGELIERYRQEGKLKDKMAQHETHMGAVEKVKRYLGENQIFRIDEFLKNGKGYAKDMAANASLTLALGGDENMKEISHYVDGGLIMGMNSKPGKKPGESIGKLEYFTVKTLEYVLERLEKGDFSVEEWVRLEAKVDGKPIPLATSELYLGEDRRVLSSHYTLEIGGKSERQDGSGLLIATGAGSGGWYDSECRAIHPNGNAVPLNEKFARYLATALYRGRFNDYELLEGRLDPGQELVVKSWNKTNGIVSSDSVECIPFPYGSTAVVRISNSPLRVVKMG